MKRIIILMFTLISTYAVVWGQKYNKNIDYKTDAIVESIIQYPLAPLGDEYKTYVRIATDKIYEEYVELPYELIDDQEKADLVLQMSITDIQIQPNGIDTIVSKSSQGGKDYSFKIQAKITGNVHISIYDNHRKQYIEKYDNDNMVVYWKDDIEISGERALAIIRDQKRLVSRIAKDHYFLFIEPMRTLITNKYKTINAARKVNFFYINQPSFYQSHFDYYNFINLQRAFYNVELDSPIDERIPFVDEYIKQQLELGQLYSKNDDPELKITVMGIYNAAAASFLVDKFDDAKLYIEMAEASQGRGHCANALKSLKREIEIAEQRLKVNNKTNSFGQ